MKKLKHFFPPYRIYKAWVRYLMNEHGAFMRFPPYRAEIHQMVTQTRDPVRYTSLALALHAIEINSVQGALAEVGVYRGNTARIIHKICPDRSLYLFDTFEGFPAGNDGEVDERFRDTCFEQLAEMLGDLDHVIIRKGIFPATAEGLEGETFAFVMLDVDKHDATMAGLEFFYPRVPPGGFLMAHDYHSPESNYAVSKAVTAFMRDKPDPVVALADSGGSVMIPRIRGTTG
jgi:O-methyltransferase